MGNFIFCVVVIEQNNLQITSNLELDSKVIFK